MRHLSLLGDLGFCLSLDKSVVQPIHVLEHLGYILNSLDMPVSTTDHNFKKFLDTTNKIFPYAIPYLACSPISKHYSIFFPWC